MAGNWDRDEGRGGSNQWRGGEGGERSSSIFGDGDRERPWGTSGGRSHDGEDRGFFQRVGEQVRSWVGDDEGPAGHRADQSGGNRYDRAEPWGGGDWAGSYDGGRGGPAGGEYRGRRQSWSEGDGGGSWRGGGEGRGPSHYGSEHGFGGFQGDYSGGAGQGGFGGEGDYRGGRQSFSGGAQGRTGFHQDNHYRSWRARQIEQMDRDYEEYCRDRQQSFQMDFASWRQNRQVQGGSAAGASASTGSSGTTGLMAGSGGPTGGSDEGAAGTGSTASSSASGGETTSKGEARSKR